MTKAQRVRTLLFGLFGLLVGAQMMLAPEKGYNSVIVFLSITLIFRGLRWLIYYVRYARCMVNGRWSFYVGAITFDLGFFTLFLTQVPQMYVMAYLIAVHAFTALVSLMRAREAKSLDSPRWRWAAAVGITDLIIVIVCLIFFNSMDIVTFVYGLGMVYSSCINIAHSFRKTALVYIP